MRPWLPMPGQPQTLMVNTSCGRSVQVILAGELGDESDEGVPSDAP